MRDTYRMFQRGKVFYTHHNKTGRQHSLATSDKAEAARLLRAKNDAANSTTVVRALGRAYLTNADEKAATRNWSEAFDYLCSRGKDSIRERWKRLRRSEPFATLLKKVIVETTAM